MTLGMPEAVLAAVLVSATACLIGLAARLSQKSAAVRRLDPTFRSHAVNEAPALSVAGTARLRAPSWLPAALVDAGCDLSPDTVWSAWVGGAGLSMAIAAVVSGPVLALLVTLVAVVAPLTVLRVSRGRGPARLEAALPEGLESVARALRSGASLRQAIGEAASATPGPLGQELLRVSVEATHGMPLLAALEALAVRRPLPGVRLAVAALCLGVETGGAQARAVDGVATTLRERLAVAAEARALASQARMSALVIGLAPIGFGVFAATTDPKTAQFLLHTSAGVTLLAAGLTLDGLGWLWMQRLCRVTR
ncbi:MAG TPA: type II secretion system F family protein [Acidimicrobiales bacterium]|nr:type II secretion system F family protein [Acidimicrobiales bacterium]